MHIFELSSRTASGYVVALISFPHFIWHDNAYSSWWMLYSCVNSDRGGQLLYSCVNSDRGGQLLYSCVNSDRGGQLLYSCVNSDRGGQLLYSCVNSDRGGQLLYSCVNSDRGRQLLYSCVNSDRGGQLLYLLRLSAMFTQGDMLVFSPFLTISLCRAGHYFIIIQYFRSCAMCSVSRYFFMSFFMLSLHLFFGRPLLLVPETSSLGDFAQTWLGSCLKQLPKPLLFSRKVSTGFTCASFRMSSFLMWSNLVFPLAHLNILISAEFSLLSSFFLMAQHSEPYVIAGLMIVLKTLSFNFTGVFPPYITPGR